MTMDKFLAGKRRQETINNNKCPSYVKGTFEERYKRVTLYFELPLFDKVQELRREGKIYKHDSFCK